MGSPAPVTGKIITSVLRAAAPWLKPVEPTIPFLRETRFEMRTADEAMSARRVAEAYRVRQLGLDQTTRFHVPSMVTSVLIEPSKGAPAEVVILRAAYGTGGATSKHEAQAVEDKCFARLRNYLKGWEAQCKKMFPKYIWTGPDPELCGLHRLGGGGCFITDTCTTARCTQEILITMVRDQVVEKIGAVEWASMSDEEREEAVRCHAVHCWQHIRNIFLAAMSSAMSTLLKDMLEDDLDAFTSQERIATDMGSLLRADYKEFHQGCRYYKGAGAAFWDWACDERGDAFIVPFERADAGRQDLDFDAAVPMYINRKHTVDFLRPRVYAKGHSNILEDSVFVTHTKLQYVALIRASAIIDIRIALPLRWIAGNGPKLKDWSPFSMGPVLDRIESTLERGSRDGAVLLSSAPLAIYESMAAEQPAFKEYLEWLYEKKTVRSPNGKKKYLLYKDVLDELLDPQDEDNAATRELAIDFLRAACAEGLAKLHDKRTVLPKYLSSQDGELSFEKQAQAHLDTMGCELSNDKFAESVFGTFDRMLKRHEGISREGAAALTHAMRHKAYSPGGEDHVKRRKLSSERRTPLPPPPSGMGYCRKLPREEQLSLIEYSRLTVRDRRKVDRADSAEHMAYVKAKVKTNSQEQLEALVTEFGYGLSFFQRWKQHGVRSARDMTNKLKEIQAEKTGDERAAYQRKLDWLRGQIEMRTRGLRWIEFKTNWSSSLDDNVGTVEQLTGHLKEIIIEENEQRSAGELSLSIL